MRAVVLAALIGAVSVSCSGSVTEPSGSTFAPAYDEIPSGCVELEGEPHGEPAPGMSFYQGSDGRWYSCPVN